MKKGWTETPAYSSGTVRDSHPVPY